MRAIRLGVVATAAALAAGCGGASNASRAASVTPQASGASSSQQASSAPAANAKVSPRLLAAPAVRVYGDCRTPQLRPHTIVEACADHGMGVTKIHWTTWTTSRAAGVGTLWYNDCHPYCAAGHVHYVPNTKVVLSRPVRGAARVSVWSRMLTTPEPPGYDAGPFHGGAFPLVTQPD